MNFKSIIPTALLAVTCLASVQVHADYMASIAINPATGEVSLTLRWATGNNLAGFHFMAQDLSLGGGATKFYSVLLPR